ncbi:MAG: restriction endonuclease subunit S [Ktedonobacteraceae bacterium]|nr:restriction endonuclease subunit S [Ktedonobacteraceae bacterium]
MAIMAREAEIKPGYKLTELGVIPEEWEASSWGKLATLEYGKSLRGYENTHGFYPVYGTNGPIGTHTKMLCTHPGVIVGRKGAYRGIHFSKVPFYVIDTAYYLEPREDIDLKWAYYELLTHNINQIDSGSAIPSTSRETFYNFSVVIPPLLEQHAIATALSNIDALITSLDKLIAKKRDIKQATMQQLLTGKTRLPGFSGEWQEKKLREIAYINMGQSPDSRNYNIKGVGMPLIQGNADIENRKSISRVWTTQITKICNEGDLIMTVRAPVGSIGIATKDSCLGRGVCSLKPIRDDNRFLFHLMVFLEEKWRILEQGSTFTSANSSQIAEFPLLIANSIKEQQAIATVLSDMDAEITALEHKREKTHMLKQGMMQELLTGKTRLI